jgi:hypothetical protein
LKRALIALICAASFAAAFPGAGAAQDTLSLRRQKAMIACTEDRIRLCADVPPGRGRIVACLRFNADKLSQRCFQAMTAWSLVVADAIKACLPDAQRLCPYVRPGGPRARACLRRNADKLSDRCGEALFGDEPFDAAFEACRPDLARLCPHLPPAGPRARLCILRNADKLSNACRQALLDDEPPPGGK